MTTDLSLETRTLAVQRFGVSLRSRLERSLDRTERRSVWHPWYEGRVPRSDYEILAEWAFRAARRQGHHPLVDNDFHWSYNPEMSGEYAWQVMIISVVMCETDEDRAYVRRIRRWDRMTLVYPAPMVPSVSLVEERP